MKTMKNTLVSLVVFIFVGVLTFKSVLGAECPPGQYTSGNTSCECLECPAGYSCAGGNNTGKNPCQPGKYSDLGSDSCTPCQAGQYSSAAASSSCLTCEAGYFCPAGSSAQYSCGGGTYSTPGSDYCELCPAGKSCANTSAIPIDCADGEWSVIGRDTCRPCSAGYECPDKTGETICPIGTFSPDLDSACYDCPSGQYAATAGAENCLACPAGSQCSNPAVSPVLCPEGTFSDAGADNCTACADGTVSLSDRTGCDDCPAGYECPSSSVGPIPCRAGYYSALGEATCTICPAGYYCVSQASQQEPCPLNQYADAVGQLSCMDCPAGFSCTNDTKTACKSGQYSPEGDAACYDCSAGRYCPAAAGTEFQCSEGTYSTERSVNCITCPAGYECPDFTSNISCGTGNYSFGGQRFCSVCGLSDTFIGCTLAVGSTTCQYGQYDNAGTCEPCVPGQYCPDPSATSPLDCQQGFYSDMSGAISCTRCPPGYECPTKTALGPQCSNGTYSSGGATSCSTCAEGFYCPYTDRSAVIPCPPGTYSEQNSPECEPCPAGSECPSANAPPDPCPDGSYSQGGAVACTECPAGFACPSTDTRSDSYKCVTGSYSVAGQSSCEPCPEGKFCPSTDDDTMFDCPDGYTSAGNRSICLQCPAGYECPDKVDEEGTPCNPGSYSFGGQIACTECPQGHQCASAIAAPVPCAPGYYADTQGNANCTACPAGSECSNPTIAPVLCTDGTFSLNSSVICQPCSPGYTCSNGAEIPNPPDDVCEPGNWCDGKDAFPCPAGTYNDREGGTSQLDCIPCHAGYYCLGRGATSGNSTECPAGYYCLEGTTRPRVYPCPGGTYNDSTGVGSENDCTICPAGFYCTEGSSVPEPCEPGFYCVAGQTTAFRNPCPGGTFTGSNGLTNATECETCPVGHYCPYGSANTPSITPLECPPGSYNPQNRSIDLLSCVECDPGRSCNVSGLESPNGDCDQGHYCPLGTAYPSTYPCQPGRYTDLTNLTRSDECYPCPAGSYCTLGTANPYPCQPGHYCPMFTPFPTRYACPPGTYSNRTDNEKLTDCTICDPGFYCSGGESGVTGFCPPGYYCPSGTVASDQFPCDNTTYNPTFGKDAQDDCKPCTQGHYCEKGTVNPVECPLGTYMPYGATNASDDTSVVGQPAGRESDCIECPAGSLCMNGDVTTTGCGLGKFSMPGNSECEICLAGYYCDNNTTSYDDMINNKKCPAGYYCRAGLQSESNKEDCTKAHYCPEETPVEVPCPTGTYNPDTTKGNITDCLPCTAGYFCLERSWSTSGNCDPGYFCPTEIPNVFPDTMAELPLIGSYGPRQIACPGGTYRDTPNAEVVEDCAICPAGWYCPSGSVNPLECTQGYYCVEGREVPEPCRKGTYGNSAGLTSPDNCTLCDCGYYCDSEGMVVPRGQCDAGYLCYSGSNQSDPIDGTTGELCPRGGYCEQGRCNQTACPPGTYSNSAGQTNARDCKQCDAGFYCSAASSPEPDGPCAAGYFCTTGSSTPFQNPCANGTYCPVGSFEQTECPLGTYQPEGTSETCLPCEPGFTCPYTGMATGIPCPAGSYCPSPYLNATFSYNKTVVAYIGTYNERGDLCPLGTYNPATNQKDINGCEPCPRGQYCNQLGATEPTGNCSAGYICYNGSRLSEPSQQGDEAVSASEGERCYAGMYCPERATAMLPCPVGTFYPNVGAGSADECEPCSAGKYCNSSGLTTFTGVCDPGFYCVGGASSPRPLDLVTDGGSICPINSYCSCEPDGCAAPTPCLTGLYANETGLTECVNCDPGYFCVMNRSPELCSAGHYCIGTQGDNPDPSKRQLEDVEKPCPVGTYSNVTGLSAEADCRPCDPGYFCDETGLTGPRGRTAAGFYSNGTAGSINPFSCAVVDSFDTVYDCGPCPAGSHCIEGSPAPARCPRGTFSNEGQLESEDQCNTCTPGYFCDELGRTTETGECDPGYYCTGGSQVSAPNASTGWGDICPFGHFCPAGAEVPIACEAGTYADVLGLSACKICPEGFYCVANATTGEPCPAGNYCPNGTESRNQFRCPAGTYSGITEAKSLSDCTACRPGQYCTTGSSEPTGNCSAGFYCTLSATVAEPFNATDGGGRCTAGFYCPSGAAAPIPCTAGWYCDIDGLSEPANECDEGFYCSGGSAKANPDGTDSTGGPCPPGRYCPKGSPFGEACPPGTYVDTWESKNISDCNECDPGKYCSGYNLTEVSGNCSVGYYCPGGQNTSTPTEYICSSGYFCPSGSSQELPCGNGTYQASAQQGECEICPEGYYCDATPGPVITFANTECVKGYYCPPGTAFRYENPCPPGRYNNKTGAKSEDECNSCLGGYYCNEYGMEEPINLCSQGYFCNSEATSATPSETSTTGECPLGFYCPEGTISPYPCPPGSYGSNGKLGSRDECQECDIGQYCAEYNMTGTSGSCDAGYFCPANSTSRQQEECGAGKYCAAGTTERKDCPVGSYSNATNLKSDTECLPCTAGMYCDAPGLEEPAGQCAGGFYCPEGSTTATPNTTYCQGNFRCPNGSATPWPCEDGTYVDWDKAEFCPPCEEGFKCTSADGKVECPDGHYCPAGTGDDEIACPKGTYNPDTGSANISQCLACDAGKYCDTPGASAWTGDCDPGYYCVSGMDRPRPDGDNSTAINGWCFDGVQRGYGGRCPPGSYCVGGSSFPQLCPAGNYSAGYGSDSCEPCQAGYFCEEGTSNFTQSFCPAGHYCPESTSSQYQYPCPAGTYNNGTHKTSENDCVNCDGGMYCPSNGTVQPTLPCREGYFCPEGSVSATEFGCASGHYCPEGSPNQIPCTAGYYCDAPLLDNVTAECDAGFYCEVGSSKANGSDSGGICPKGHFCLRGTPSPRPCPAGTYRNETGGVSEDDCVACDPGYYCSENGANTPKDLCDPGFYCDGTTKDITTATPPSYKCPRGHKCPAGSIEAVRCDSGYYQDEEAQATCKECPEGYYCDNFMAPVVVYNESSACPMGHFCPNGTKFDNEFPCPAGTFRNVTGGTNQDACFPCIGGMYCDTPGLPEPRGDCEPGYYCKSGASSSAPAAFGDERGPCIPGFYCESRTTSPTPCMSGTYNPMPGSTNSSACLPCTLGNYCPFENMTSDGFVCKEGYYCPLGSTSETEVECEAGFFCEAGMQPQKCPPGTWSNRTGLTSETNCTDCPAGFYCPDSGQTSVDEPCLGGYYCLEGQSSSYDNVCPYGVHCPNGSEIYRECAEGTYTNTEGQSSCELCPERFYCMPSPPDDFRNILDCPEGYYCPNGTGRDWKPCPAGTYSNVTGLSDVLECLPCEAGKYCDGTILTAPNGDCDEGYFCTVGVNIRAPANGTTSGENCTCSANQNTGWGGICPRGFYCRGGSTSPVPCENGTYADEQGLSECKVCKAGFYCPPQSETYSDKPCPSGHYCPAGTEIGEKYPCRPGYFNPNIQSESEDFCELCLPGEYCSTSGMSSTDGNCSEGYYCVSGSDVPMPSNPSMGGECQPGFYCPSGASSPYSCPVGWYCQNSKLPAPEGECAAGYYCVMNATRPQPDGSDPTGYPCPEGNFCTKGTDSITPCPIGTYSNTLGLRSESECNNCSARMFCNTTAALDTAGLCAAGYYCPGSNIQADPPENACPAGYACPVGSDLPTPCDSGYYQDEEAQSECKLCPAGCVCNATFGPVTSSCAVLCPEGHYCPNGTRYAEEFRCPKGTYFNGTGLQSENDCLPCLATFACDTEGLDYPTTKCSAGYYCRSSSDSTTPNLAAELANECPPGFYCPEGTAEPMGCPIGTFSSAFGLMNETECTQCTAGYFCDSTNLTSYVGPCSPGFYCPAGSSSAEEIECDPGSYCPGGTGTPQPCPVSTFSNAAGLSLVSQCLNCTAGFYCEDRGRTNVTGACLEGFYCPSGSSSATEVTCPIGTYCPGQSTEPKVCKDGFYAPTQQMASCELCPEGFYCLSSDVIPGDSDSVKTPCAAGYFCPNGTGPNQRPCPHGTYSTATELSSVEQCTPCEGGKFCEGVGKTSVTRECDPGYYCESGVWNAQPVTEDGVCNITFGSPFPSLGNICPPGFYCEAGSSSARPCDPGFYMDEYGASACFVCPAGYYCLTSTVNFTANPCPVGHYCPNGTTYDTQYSCPVGTYNNLTTRGDLSDCLPCPRGRYCSTRGTVDPEPYECEGGYYCTGGATTPQDGEICDIGYYCPEGTTEQILCPAGRYCERPQLSDTSGPCQAGFYCPNGSIVSNQEDCPVGFYCEQATPVPVACPAGTFGSSPGLASRSLCSDCTGGSFCASEGRDSVTNDCDPGYFCPGGNTAPANATRECWQGYHCPAGSSQPLLCNAGFFQNLTGQASCQSCPEGYYCPPSVAVVTPTLCPEGSYCPIETGIDNGELCPPGTYNNQTGRSTQSECLSCHPKYYCAGFGNTEGTGGNSLCLQGYYCDGGAMNATQHSCPQGTYCVEGSAFPTPCRAGTTLASENNVQESDCDSCDPGFYCPQNSTSTGEKLPCDPGYVCSGGAYVPNPVDNITGYECPPGHRCPGGVPVEIQCDPGTYQPLPGQDACWDCEAGTYCPDVQMTDFVICPEGKYCLERVSFTSDCLIGTYSNLTGLKSAAECLGCPAGRYCDLPGLTDPSSYLCTAGYICNANSTSTSPADDGVNGPCPVGHYCPQGTPSPVECPIGTIRSVVGAASEDDCSPCPPGRYCSEPGRSTPNGDCLEGYYCPDNAKITSPQPTGYQCPAGSSCGNGTADPSPCDAGTYQPNVKETVCLPCEIGHFCPSNSSTPVDCPAGNYCPAGSPYPISCKNGFYGNGTGLQAPDDCSPCITGSYCTNGVITAPCAAGYHCISGSPTPTPDGTSPEVGGPCPFGYYCLEGTIDPLTCPDDLVISNTGASSVNNCTTCPAGYTCLNSTIPLECEAGHYCPASTAMTPCPVGTYSNITRATSVGDCDPCTPGYWCSEEGTVDPTLYPCPVGHYCPLGTGGTPNETSVLEPVPCPPGTYRSDVGAGSLGECYECPAGYYCPNSTTVCYNCTDSAITGQVCDSGMFCPAGSATYQWCEAGFYCNETKDKVECPAGYYCPERSPSPTPCPDGSYCDVGAVRPTKCPLGYFEIDGSERRSFVDTCSACAAGSYGAAEDRMTCTTCRAGVICKEAATTDNPEPENATMNATNSFPCPPGYYCPSGAIVPIACPVGTYNPNEYGESLAAQFCIPCPVNYFTNLPGQIACQTCGGQATQPLTGQSSCQCSGSGREFQPSDQNCPCASGYQVSLERNGDCVRYIYPLCPAGTSRTQEGSCYTDAQWEEHCRNDVCQTPSDYQGVDKVVGACKCIVEDLDTVCDAQCRARQPNLIEFCCPDPLVSTETQIRVLGSDGNYTYYSTDELNIINSENAISIKQCSSGTASCSGLYITESIGAGFIGAYDPDPTLINDTLSTNSKDPSTVSRKRRSIDEYAMYPGPRVRPPSLRYDFDPISNRMVGRRLLQTTVSVYSGILNPVTCVDFGNVVLFSVSNANYPVYDQNNLYNTNQNFDFGGFRDLENQMALTGSTTTLFAYQFNSPGVYAFMLSSDNTKKFYVSVMNEGGTCTEQGPYFPPTPLYFVQNGLTLDSTILLEPDWFMIAMLLLVSIFVVSILVVALTLFRKYGWAKNSFLSAYYRAVGFAFNLDTYSSKGSTVHSIKKYHPNTSASNNTAVAVSEFDEMRDDEFWDHERQVDMEQFSSQQFYGILTKQSNDVTSSVSKQKDEVKSLYQKVAQQTQSLKDLWAAKLNLQGRSSLATDEELAEYERKKEELDIELERRKLLGEKYLSVLQQQRDVFVTDEQDRRNHQVNFDAFVINARRILDHAAKSLEQGTADVKDIQFEVTGKAGLIISKMKESVGKECKRVGAWGVLKSGTGAQLIEPGSRKPLKHGDIFAPDGTVVVSESVCFRDETLGITVPAKNMEMLLANGQTMVIPKGQCFVHPKTGNVLPMQGNLCYDPVTSKIVSAVDTSSGDVTKSDELLIPYIPYPKNDSTGAPLRTKLPQLERRADLRLGAPMIDSATGLTVPICGVTVHPTSGDLYPVGGSFTSPITNLPTAIELGSLMIDTDSERPLPILAVGFDSEGNVIPIGGTTVADSQSSAQIPILLSDTFKEPLSGKDAHVSGVRSLPVPGSRDQDIVPTAGGNRAVLNASVLSSELKTADTLKMYLEALISREASDQGTAFSVRPEISHLETAMKELDAARSRKMADVLRKSHDLLRAEERADVLAATGGCAGMMEFEATGQLLPILVGTEMKDPAGSDLKVPILGIDKAKLSGNIVPLAGSMEDPAGKGLVPIAIGSQGVDAATAKIGKVAGAKLDHDTGVVVPILQTGNLVHKRQRKPAPGSLAMLEEENAAKRGFWRRQRQREGELNSRLANLMQDLSAHGDSSNADKVDEHLETISNSCYQLSGALDRECERRQMAKDDLTAILPPDVLYILCENDGPEKTAEETLHLDYKKLVEMVRNFIGKLQMEETRKDERLSDAAKNQDPITTATAKEAIMIRYEQAQKKIQSELSSHLENRIEKSSIDLATLEYLRKISELLTVEARELLKGTLIVSGDYEVVASGVYGDDINVSTQSELVPLLKQLIALLESGIHFQLAPEMLSALQQTHSSQQQVKILEAIRETAMQQQRQMEERQAALARSQPLGRDAGPTVLQISVDKDGYQGDKGSHSSASTPQITRKKADGKKQTTRRSSKASTTLQSEKSASARELIEKQTLEIARLEAQLRAEEIAKINKVISEVEEKKKVETEKIQKELTAKLKTCKTDEEKEKIMLEYAEKMRNVEETFEKEKQRQLAEVQKALAAERKRRKKALHMKQVREAQEAGLDPDKIVPDILDEDDDQVSRDLKLLALQQDKLIAELLKAYKDEEGDDPEGKKRRLDEEMEARIRALNNSRAASLIAQDDIGELLESEKGENDRFNNMRANMQKKMKMRRARRKSKPSLLSEEAAKSMSSEEAETISAELEKLDQAQSDRIDAAVLSALDQAEREKRETHRLEEVERMLSQNGDLDQDQRDRIMAEYKETSQNIERQISEQRNNQRQILIAKLEARKKLKEELAKEKAVAKQVKESTLQTSTLPDGTNKGSKDKIVGTFKSVEDREGDKSSQMASVSDKELSDSQIEKLAKLEQQHLKEKEKMESILEQEMKEEQDKIEKQLNEQAGLQEAAAIARANSEADSKNLNEKQTEKLIKQYKKQAEALNKSLTSERKRQMETLQAKMRQRRKMKEEQMAAEQNARTERELLSLREERAGDELGQASVVERKVLEELAADKNGGTSLEQFVQEVLLPRHLKESAELQQMMERESEAYRNEGKAKGEADRYEAKELLLARQLKEINELLLSNAGEPASKVMKLKKQLESKHDDELKKFDVESEKYIASVTALAVASLAITHAQKRLQLREKHLRELADTLRGLDPEEMLVKKYADEAARTAAEAERFRQSKAAEMNRNLERMKQERRRKEAQANQKMNDEIASLERELSSASMHEKKNLEASLQAESKAADDRSQTEEERIKHMNVESEERDRLLKEHRENTDKLKSQLKQNQSKARADLQRRLAERRQKTKDDKMAEIKEDFHKEKAKLEVEQAAKMDALVKESETALKSTEDNLKVKQEEAVRDSRREMDADKYAGTEQETAIPFAPGHALEDWSSLMMASPFFQELKSVEEVLKKHFDEKSQIVRSSISTPFIDIQDAQWMLGNKLQAVDLNSISTSEFVVYRFGVFIAKLMQQVLEISEVRLLLASQLPNNNYHRNAFRHSIFYQRAPTATLFIRRERLSSVGDLVMVIVHSMAHIAANQMEDDSDPYFLRAFYKGMKTACEDLFFARARAVKGVAAKHTIANTGSSLRPIETAKSVDVKTEILEDLMDVKVVIPSSMHFTKDSISRRISRYQEFGDKRKIQNVISSKQTDPTDKELVAARLRKLRGRITEPAQSVTVVPQEGTDVSQQNAQQALQSKAIRASNAADEIDEMLVENSSNLSRLVEGMEDEGIMDDCLLGEAKARELHRLKLQQDHFISHAKQLTDGVKK